MTQRLINVCDAFLRGLSIGRALRVRHQQEDAQARQRAINEVRLMAKQERYAGHSCFRAERPTE